MQRRPLDRVRMAAPPGGGTMSPRLLRILLVLLAVLSAGQARANFIPLDLFGPGDALITRDTELGLDWLDVYATRNTSADQIRAGAGGWVADGWRHATTAEVCSL